jgi:lipopolysaccharide assembly outer membrane protein LptD (OstA)
MHPLQVTEQMSHMQRIVLVILGTALITGLHPAGAAAQSLAADQDLAPAAMSDELTPLLPPGISDFPVELYGKQAYTWTMPDGTKVIEIMGDFSARMGQHKLAANDAVIWFNKQMWQDRPYLDLEIYLWQGAEIIQPGGTTEKGTALLVTLRSFGTLILNTDAHAAVDDSQGDLFGEGLQARGLLTVAPPAEPSKAQTPVQVAPTVEQLLGAQPKPPRIVAFSVGPDGQLHHEQHGDQSVIIATGDVFVSQGSPAQSGEYLELHADAAVLYLRADKLGQTLPGLFDQEQAQPKKRKGSKDDLEAPPTDLSPPGESGGKKDKLDRQAFREWISAAYLEGDVVLSRGGRMIRASKLYYDFEAERALILDVVMRALEPSKGLPIYVRAEQVRQLSPTEYRADKAQITTSEFYTPHVAIGAQKVYLTDNTPRNEKGDIIGVQAGTYKAYNTTLNVEGTPLAWWPVSQGNFSTDRMAFRSAKFGYESNNGAVIETRWYLFNLLGLQQPEGYDATLEMDYFTKRGPGVGINMDYKQDDYFGLLKTYYINDHGKDDLGSGSLHDVSPDTENRGRALWRHRQLLGKGWELSLEGSYISDDQFMQEYYRNEWENAKPPEDAIYLVKRQDNWQFSTLANWRLNDFLTETEHFPDAMFSLIGEPLGEYATLYSESRAGVVRYRTDDNNPPQPSPNGPNPWNNPSRTGSVVRGDTREEVNVPVPDIGPVKLTPYAMGRVTGWDDSPTPDSGGIARGFASYGVRGNTMFSKVDDSVESEILDLHRLRHVVKPEASVWNAHSNKDPLDLSPFDPGVETIDDFGGGTVGVRQRFQTQRGSPGKWRTVDWIVLDVMAGFFNDHQKNMRTDGDYIYSRPEESRSSNFLATNFQYRLSDSTVVVYDGVYDTNRGNMGTSAVSLAVEREPRMSYFVGWRYVHDTDNSLLGGGANYKLTEKHSVAFREFYDLNAGRNYTTELAYIRKWPRWYSSIAFDVDRSLDDWGVNFSVWPEGAPKMGLGSRRFTGLSDSVGISPE